MARPETFAAAERLILPPPLAGRALLARAVVWLEAAWPLLRLGVVATALFTAFGLVGFWQLLPGLVRWTIGMGLIAGWGWIGWQVVRTIGWPSQARALARLEAAAGLPRGLLRLLLDRPAGPEHPATALLWATAHDQALAAGRRIRLIWPRLDCRSGDRYGLGPLAALLLALGWLAAADQREARLAATFSPYWTSLAGIDLDVQLVPPAYTGRAPSLHRLTGGARAHLTALAGSQLRLSLDGIDPTATTVQLRAPDDDVKTPLRPRDGGLGVTVAPVKAGTYRLTRGWRTLATLTIRLTPDRPPAVTLLQPPVPTPNGALRLHYRLTDDFGATRLAVDLQRQGETRRIATPTPPAGGDGVLFVDLTPDPWAGLPVQLRLVASDAAGNSGRSAPQPLTLPERRFTEPFARHIIAVRRDLLRRPAARAIAASRLAFLSSDEAGIDGDLTVYAGLRAARWRLIYDKEDSRGWSVARLLWDVAVDVEGGDTSRSLDDLRQKLDDIARRMDGASDAELAAMMDQLTSALAQHLGQLAARSAAPPAGSGGGQVIDASALGDMLADLRERLAAGDQAGAQASLANLRALIEALKSGAGTEAAASRQALQRATAGARDLESQQQALFGDTVLAGMEGRQALRQLRDRQQALEQATQGLAQQLQQAGLPAPGALARARTAMGEAAAALGEGRAQSALGAQARALRALGQATGALQAMAQEGGGGLVRGLTDPMGRMSGGGLGPEFKLPDVHDRRLVDSIRKTLESRAADPRLPEAERAYYLRLLKQF